MISLNRLVGQHAWLMAGLLVIEAPTAPSACWGLSRECASRCWCRQVLLHQGRLPAAVRVVISSATSRVQEEDRGVPAITAAWALAARA